MDANFISNRFTGSGVAGIYVDGNAATSQYGGNVQILDNKFAGANYEMANVVLAANTKNCQVVGNDLTDNVFDEGVNNKVINITKMKGRHHSKGSYHHNPSSVLRVNRVIQEMP